MGLVLGCVISFAQTSPDTRHVEGQSSFYAEVGGPGVLFSANFDKRFHRTHLGWGARAGLGFVTAWEDEYDTTYRYYFNSHQRSVLTIPVQINYIFGKPSSPHTFEAGAGLTLLSRKMDVFNYYDEEKSQLLGTFSFMYRRQPLNGGFSWRIGFTPVITSAFIQPSAGASVGYNF